MNPIESVRPVRILVGIAPASFEEVAADANLAFVTEATERGTAFIVDFRDLEYADHDHELTEAIKVVRDDWPEFDQIRLECA